MVINSECPVHEGNMSSQDDNYEQNEENATFFDIEGMSEAEITIRKRREEVYENMCKPPIERILDKDMAKKHNVEIRTITRDKHWCKTDRPHEWVNILAKHGFLSNTMEYETRMKNNLAWLYRMRDSQTDPEMRLAYQKEITTTENNIIEVGSKHAFYQGIKKIVEENEAKKN